MDRGGWSCFMTPPATQRTPTKDIAVLGAEAMLASIVEMLHFSGRVEQAAYVAQVCDRRYIQAVVREARQHFDYGGFEAWRQGGKS